MRTDAGYCLDFAGRSASFQPDEYGRLCGPGPGYLWGVGQSAGLSETRWDHRDGLGSETPAQEGRDHADRDRRYAPAGRELHGHGGIHRRAGRQYGRGLTQCLAVGKYSPRWRRYQKEEVDFSGRAAPARARYRSPHRGGDYESSGL